MQPEDLIAFEDEIAECFNRGEIKAPVHLAGGNERQLIDIFRDIRPADWVCGTWRAHYHALLKGVPRESVRAAILDGRSIALCFPDHRVLCSAIVGGIMPIALGIAWAIKRRGGSEWVYCFIGDMAAQTGIAHETMKYAAAFEVPITFIIEDNGIGGAHVPTDEVRGHAMHA